MNAIDASVPVFLDSNVKIEPLTFRWYAWSHLVSPVSLALNLAYRYLPMLKSFIANPGVHEAAAKNPKMLGGSFLELRQQDIGQVRALQQTMLQQGAALLGFADDLLALDRQLHKTETGFSLDHLYSKLPASLAGMVEAGYDLNNRSSLRIAEELAYHDAQLSVPAQEIGFSRTRDDMRNFFLNTPRLETQERLILPAAFAHACFDLLSASRITPVPFGELADALGADAAVRERLRGYFQLEPPPRNAPEFHGEGVRLRYFGHACVLIQSNEVSILVDPFLTWDRDDAEGRLTFHDLPDHIDYVFFTHNHQDHFSIEALLQLRNRIGTILVPRNNANNLADPSMKLTLQGIGHDKVRVMDPMDRVDFAGGRLTSLPFYGEHAVPAHHPACWTHRLPFHRHGMRRGAAKLALWPLPEQPDQPQG
ncbi:MBL fold metallo-hydrolase [Dyella silvatica]|uniref:MBL fold metallo-hydrolase n=1 Tax=Dyella silvatica TaxID=2992128 RepID=UPI00224EE309|nr:MBL fold metallo-hydrolase [Dyella silvatica]